MRSRRRRPAADGAAAVTRVAPPTRAGDPPRLRGLDLTVQRRLDGLLHGDHLGLRLGPGSDPEELARYQPGHDVRRIDWKVTARAREPHVWLTRAEHELDTWLLLDRTPSMAFGTVDREKGELAATVAATVGLLTDAPGNRLGIASLDRDGLAWQQPRPGRIAAHAVLRAGGERDGVAATGLADALTALAARHRRPGLRVVVSDLLDPAGNHQRPFDWEQPLRRLSRRHEVIVVEIVDPRELDLPAVGQLVLVDPESGRQREIFSGDARLRTTYADAAAEHRRATAAAVAATGAGHLPLRTDQDWVPDLARFVRSRRRLPARRVAPRRR
jgi:uncharacterized protein (DUF58 family)